MKNSGDSQSGNIDKKDSEMEEISNPTPDASGEEASQNSAELSDSINIDPRFLVSNNASPTETEKESESLSNDALESNQQYSIGNKALRVPKKNPLQQSIVPPEVVFFGEPRNPPPGEAYQDLKFHGSLLYWARHATVAPRTSEERLAVVFPRGRLSPDAPKFRIVDSEKNLTFTDILNGFVAVMDDIEDSKAFVSANIDIVPSKLFLRALTAEKLVAQSVNDLERMSQLKTIRSRYILAHDQLFFPLNIEIQKAETRVMTYIARSELTTFAKNWDEIEMTLHFATLLAARYTWDGRVKEVLDNIKLRIKDSVGYMASGLEKDLMSREFRRPGLTAELFLNASMQIQREMPELYAKVRPEVQLLHEAYFVKDAAALTK